MKKKINISDMKYDKAILFSLELAKSIEKKGFKPDRVIGIATGGILPAQIISDYFEIPLVLIKVARPMTSAKKHLGLNKLPQPVKSFLRRAEMNLGLYRLMENRTITDLIGDLEGRKYIIVDDSLDTGKTISKVLWYLEENKNIRKKDVLIAVLTQIFNNAKPQADCMVFKNYNFCFPWSQDSGEYNKFLKFCRDKAITDMISIWK